MLALDGLQHAQLAGVADVQHPGRRLDEQQFDLYRLHVDGGGMADRVLPRLANAGQHLTGNPLLESLCRGQLAAEDQGIDPALTQEADLLHPAGRGGVAFHDIPFIHMALHRIPRIAVAQRLAHIDGTEQHAPGFIDQAHLAKLHTVETHHLHVTLPIVMSLV
ncbi:hypothetical protein D3C85_662560 [compost metagenome]